MEAPQTLLALKSAALSAERCNFGLSRKLGLLGSSLNVGALAAASAIHETGSIQAIAKAAMFQGATLRSLGGVIGPGLSTAHSFAAQKLAIELAAMQAATSSSSLDAMAAREAMEQTAEAQHVAKALAQADTAEDGAHLFAKLVAILVSLVGNLNKNTPNEWRGMGWIALFQIILAVLSCIPNEPAETSSYEEREAFADVRRKIDGLGDTLSEMIETQRAIEASYVSSLPRAELRRNGRIRIEPNRLASILFVGKQGTPLAVVANEGRWKQVVYRDPLTGQLAQGWVYGTLVEQFDD